MKNILTIFLLLLSVFSLSYGQGPDVKKEIGGCTTPKFKTAELAAYQAMLKAKTEAARVLAEKITSIEEVKKQGLAKENLDYLNGLKTCKNDSCTEAKKIEYDDGVFIIQAFAKKELLTAEEKEKTANETAQKKYNEDVKEAEKLYCFSYEASGQDGPVVYSGTICSLEKPFTVTGTQPMFVYEFKFVPSTGTDGTTGTMSYSLNQGMFSFSGNGTYKVENAGTGKFRIIAQTQSTASIPVATTSGGGPAHIDLTPLPARCNGQ